MITQIKKRSSSLVVVLPKEFILFIGLNEGDWIDMSEVIKVKPLHPMVIKKTKKVAKKKKNQRGAKNDF